MLRIKALSLTQEVNDWLTHTRQPRVLHVFDNACNLINEKKDVLSLVTLPIGNGPFNLVVADEINFADYINARSEISVDMDQIRIGNLIIDVDNAKLWNPRPDWERLHAKRADILDQIPSLRASGNGQSKPQFSDSLASDNISVGTKLASKLAGLGQGLTPAGDDFIMGALYAVWIIHPREVASELADEIAKTAAPLTTSLSAAWIGSAGRGEAGQVWHEFLDALMDGDEAKIQLRMENILAVGETSGADALTGFISVLNQENNRSRYF